jgi:hypothetical protein
MTCALHDSPKWDATTDDRRIRGGRDEATSQFRAWESGSLARRGARKARSK